MYLDGAADGKPGTPASWTFIDRAGRQVTISVRETHGLLDPATATAIVSADAWIPVVEDEAANPTP
ncbi:hypothetical protein G7085_18430 [Tessaracoccus sp. HDW20]|uniref:hypothetical protein n=1 Tax=Tessaracoccus coleopterorum TaxID=2714950 RepID=UPI0018D28996|nr:hypothetical protein [Tessaracoccus coleopterorum]NHB85865.1 hypothetical protein [Tessaracoccus coleopterorum]